MDEEWVGRIRDRAYFLWESEGCGECCDLEYWLRAEAAEIAEREAAEAEKK